MGYITWFSFAMHGTPEKEQEVLDYAEKHKDDDLCCELVINECLEANWYDFDKDFEKFAKRFPDVLFVVCGDGEESWDIWEERFKGDEMEYHEAKIPPFTRLKTPDEIKEEN